MRPTCRVRSRSTSAAGAVHVRVRAMARRISADSGTPAAAALARQSADSLGVTRTATKTGRRLAIGMRRHGGKGGDAPARELHRSAGLLGFEGAESLASPWVIPGVGWLSRLSGRSRPPRRGTLGRQNRHTVQSGDCVGRCQQPVKWRCPKGSSVVPDADRPPPTAPPTPPGEPRRSSSVTVLRWVSTTRAGRLAQGCRAATRRTGAAGAR